MSRLLLTGMSGTGKSTLISALCSHGLNAIDADDADWSHWVDVAPHEPDAASTLEPGRDWMWREDRFDALLAGNTVTPLVVAGCAANMRRFLPRFDHVVLLTAPDAVLLDRLATRTSNTYGKQPAEAQRVLLLKRTIEPRLRSIATEIIDTAAPLETVIARVLFLAQSTG
jgi:dephospho-CoA kinase